MMILITYDVNTETAEGKYRLRQVSKICKNYGQRVQNSVFECIVTPSQIEIIKDSLNNVIDKELDSIRFYYLGSKWEGKIEHSGCKQPIDLNGVLLM